MSASDKDQILSIELDNQWKHEVPLIVGIDRVGEFEVAGRSPSRAGLQAHRPEPRSLSIPSSSSPPEGLVETMSIEPRCVGSVHSSCTAKLKRPFAALMAACGLWLPMPLASPSQALAESPYAPVPMQETLPVVFWAHYMPQIPSNSLQAISHARGNLDFWPLLPNGPTRQAEFEQSISAALDAGINGFACLGTPDEEMWDAAKSVTVRTGKMFYLAPEWCDMGKDPKADADRVVEFVVKHKDDPQVFRVNGKQVHFIYGDQGWAKVRTINGTSVSGIEFVKNTTAKVGVPIMLVPTIYWWDQVTLDRPDLACNTNWPAFGPATPGKPAWILDTPWDGLAGFTTGPVRDDVLQAVRTRLALRQETGKDFLLVPDFAAGYDSSSRYFQAIHCRFDGLMRLRTELRSLVEAGYRQLMLITWNDAIESVTLPTSRSPYGYQAVIRYYHELAVNGRSPFSEPQIVVSYNPEIMLGDQLYFQMFCLPEKNTVNTDYILSVRLEDEQGRVVSALAARGRVANERDDQVVEARLDTTGLAGKLEVLVPYVTVKKVDIVSGASRVMYENLRLAPIRLRYNQLYNYVPLSIPLDRIDPNEQLSLTAGKSEAATGELKTFQASAAGTTSFRRLALQEGSLSLGAYRADDTIPQAGDARRNVFLRFTLPPRMEAKLQVSDGRVLDSQKADDRPELAYVRIDSESTQVNCGPTYRIQADVSAPLVLSIPGTAEPITTTIATLAGSPLHMSVPATTADGKTTWISVGMQLTTDQTDSNMDFPLPPSGTWQRSVVIDPYNEGQRVFYLWGLTKDNKVAYSRPVIVSRIPKNSGESVISSPQSSLSVGFVQSNGIMDDFVNNHTEGANNPFTISDIVRQTLPASAIPYYLLDMEEGAGSVLNDSGTGQQLGRAWLDGDDTYQWVKSSWRGSGIRLNGSRINLHSKSMPVGEATLSWRLKLPADTAAQSDLFVDCGWKVSLLKDGRISAKRLDAQVLTPTSPLKPDWNHIVVVYDLTSLRIYVNGQEAAAVTGLAPAYQRSHSAPHFIAPKGSEVDQIEIIGTAIDANSVRQLNQSGQWRSR